jgi:hypothetical protein
LEQLRSCSTISFHLHLHELAMLDFFSNSMIQGLIYTKSISQNKNMEEKLSAMWKKFEFQWREEFGGKKF